MSIKRIFTFVATLLLVAINTGLAQSENSRVGGLKFDTFDGQKTMYQMFDQARPWAQDSLVLNFDISFFDNNRIGHILSCNDQKHELFSLFVAPDRDRGELVFNLNLTFASRNVQLPLDFEQCKAYIWHRVSLKIFPRKGTASLSVNESSQSVSFENQLPSATCNYFFGNFSHYANFVRFALVNLSLRSDKNDRVTFPLDNVQGDTVYNAKGDVFGVVESPVWLYSKHCNWELVAQLNTTEQAAIFQDADKSKIVVYSPSLTWVYDLESSQMEQREHSLEDGFKLLETGGGDNIFNPQTGEAIIFNNNIRESESSNSLSLYNYTTGSLEKFTTSVIGNRLHHSSVFANSDFSRIYQFGGFGNSTYSNRFYSLDMDERIWRELSFTGDSLPPRYYSSLGIPSGDSSGVVYLYGGYGSQSGELYDSREFYYDLYEIDIDGERVTHLRDFDLSDQNIVPCRDIIVDQANECFYTMCYKQYKASTNLALYRFNYKTGEVSAASDSIPFFSQKIQSRANLFYDRTTRQAVCAVQEYIDKGEVVISLYRLSFPAVTDLIIAGSSEKKSPSPSPSHNVAYVVLIALVGLLVFGVLIYRLVVYRRGVLRANKAQSPEEQSSESQDSTPQSLTPQNQSSQDPTLQSPTIVANSIHLIGEFAITDSAGRDISHLFSSKIRQLFLLVLFYSYRSGSRGITSNELSLILWPEKDPVKAKNIRGVTIKALRNILQDIKGVSLVYGDNRWLVDIDRSVCYCDYLELQSYGVRSGELCSMEYDQMQDYINIIGRGVLLPTLEYPWLDAFKSELEQQILSVLYPVLQRCYTEKAYQHSYTLSQILLGYAPLNLDIAKIEINSLVKMGDQAKATVKFYHFALRYNNAYGENLTFEQMTQ